MWDGQEVRARLRTACRADRALTRSGAREHRYRLGPVLTEERVVAFETGQGVTLPLAYRTFLLTVGDGGAGPYYGLFPLSGAGIHRLDEDQRYRPGYLATPFPHVDRWNPNGGPPGTGLTDAEYSDDRWVTGSMIISDFGCGAYHRLVVTGPARGQVWFDDRVSDGGMSPQADFRSWYEEWLDGLPS